MTFDDENNSRPLLIFNHNPKAGGGTILQVLNGFKKQCPKNWRKHPNRNTSCFVHIHESEQSDLKDRQKGFVISSIREPCSQYVSLWAFGSIQRGQTYSHVKHRTHIHAHNIYGQDKPFFNSTQDVARFNNFIHTEQLKGLIYKRFVKSFGNHEPQVDCWVFVENFQESFIQCLKMYENQGGIVDWNSNTVKTLVDGPPDDDAKCISTNSKNSICGNPQVSHHGSCGTYFDSELSAFVENGPESKIYEMFGYKGCCNHEYKGFHPNIVDNTKVMEETGRRLLGTSSSTSTLTILGNSVQNSNSPMLPTFIGITSLLSASFIIWLRRRRRDKNRLNEKCDEYTNTFII